MKITAFPLDLTPGQSVAVFTLCHGDARTISTPASPYAEGPGNLKGAVLPGVAERKFVGDQGVKPEAVGGDAAEVSFTVHYTFETPPQSSAFAVGMKAAVPRTAAVSVDSDVYISRAHITFAFTVVGCTLRVDYQLRGF